jgi:hypothetical protein
LAPGIVAVKDRRREIAMTAQQMTQATGRDHQKVDHQTDELPVPEKIQPDPMLRMGTGRVSAGAMTVVAVVAALILYVVLYGLNSPNPIEQTATSPALTQNAKPQAGGNSGAAAPGPSRANEGGVKG